MEEKIQLKHPQGKKATCISKAKYDTMKAAMLASLSEKGELTHKEMLQAIVGHFKNNKIQFDGAVEWYMESVKLDLEANQVIKRIPGKPLAQYSL